MKLSINNRGGCTVLRLSFFIVLLSLGISPARAQELVRTPAESSETNVAERVRQLESELERQNLKLDQLQKTLMEQQSTIQALLEKLSAPTTPAATSAKATETPATLTARSDAAPAEPQTPTVEQRLAKVEGQVLKIGPIRFSGDFRLRFDGIYRSATQAPDPPLDHVQNARARYRLRLNFDTDLYPNLSFHGQLATGPLNNPLSTNQDFTSITTRAPFSLSEAWIEYRPTKSIQLQGGRVQDIFADNSRFLFDDDLRFNGFNERYTATFKPNGAYVSSLEFRAGQYILSTPNIAVIAPNSPLARLGEIVGTAGRSARLFHQGLLVNQTFNKRWSSQFGGDIQLYDHPNQIQFASTQEGLVLLVQPGLGIALSGPLPGTGNATTTPGGVVYTAPGFQVARLTYRLNYGGFTRGDHAFPVTLNVQVARNVATGLNERDAMLAALQVGRITKRGDTSFLYVFAIKGANSMISQVTDDDLGTNTGVNIRTSHFRFEYGISRKVTFQSLFFIQNSLRRSGQYPNFFVPLGDFAPRTYRVQQQLVFSF
ncbi:MAG TPA: putative porin [Pyrinomonadaceae bacterium]|nr:putative porin [Pyrinomonadaceae bacterium]